MGARSRMTLRADVERNQETGVDGTNQPLKPDWQALATVACWVYSKARREVVDGKKVAVVEDLRAMVPLSTDITEKDKIAQIIDRSGNVIYAGPLGIESVQRKHTHLELMLKAVE
ncbi:MAG: head-tail adaptor protein [Candidatus Brocadiales bacterium]|nr:head-tail adaptor protein [Candidatus Bathyanammoxibius amoris]